MPRLVPALVVAAAGAAVVAGIRSRRRTRSPVVSTGVFANGMAYARAGDGPRTVLAIPGGPGNAAPTLRALGPALPALLAAGFTCWAVTRRRGMPAGHAIEDMADDFAALIADEFGGRVDLLLGVSMGGMIGYHLAARHPDAVGRLAVLAAGAWTSADGRAADVAFARALADRRLGDAFVAMLGFLAPQVPPVVARVIGPLAAPLVVGEVHPSFANDVVVEAEACDRYDVRTALAGVTVPTLIVGGDQDRYFPLVSYEEAARLIPGATLRIHPGQGHLRVISSGAAARDVVDFARAIPGAS